MAKLKTGESNLEKKRSHHLCHWDFPSLPSPCWHGCAPLSAISQVSWGESVCQALASLALCAAGLGSSAGTRMGLRWEMGALFLFCLLSRATPGSILANPGCKASMEQASLEDLRHHSLPGLQTSEVTKRPGHSSTEGSRSPFSHPSVPKVAFVAEPSQSQL